MGAITLCSTMPKYEQYREAWHLLREAGREAEEERMSEPEENPMGAGMARMQGALNYFQKYLEKGGGGGRVF